MVSSNEITGLLVDWGNGRQEALDKLLPLVEKELHRLAHHHMRRLQPGNTLQTTALINETYIRLVDQKKVRWQNRAHFFGIAAQMMRRILLNYVRDQKRIKRGGGAVKVSLSEVTVISAERTDELLALEEALSRLTTIDERKSRVVELRYYGGLPFARTCRRAFR
jgi:RNA polymerase sigma factor (TIGR02999 family)